jgi:ribosome maturation factor RimP
MSVPERVRAVIEPVVAAQDLDLFDLEQAGPVLRVTVERAGGLDMSAIASVTRAISRALDEHDPIAGQYTLEVSSPGLERPLRTPAHWAWAVGRQVSVKTVPNHPVGRRFAGTVTAATDDSVTLALDDPVGESLTLGLDEIEKARTTFEWGPTPKPGGPKSGGPKKPSTSTKPTKQKKVQP